MSGISMQLLSSKKVEEEDSGPWKIAIRSNSSIVNTNGLSNMISTTKYSLLSWLPKSLLEQFRRIANVYFLCISVLMLIGTYATYIFQSPLDPFSTVITLIFVLLVTSVKEGMEDLQRARSDKEENNRMVTVVRFENGIETLEEKECHKICAGDIVKMTGKTSVPADLILILTSMYNDGNQCYIETANIDGETNLKVREAPAGLLSLIKDGKLNNSLVNGEIEFEPPNRNIHNFLGALRLQNVSDPIPLSAENILLRGSLFSNTDWAYGIAVYTGQETKIQMNNRHAPSKLSTLERYLNEAIIIIFWSQVVLVTISVISIYIMGFEHFSKLPYVYTDGNSRQSVLPLWLEQWFVFFLLYNNFIPISLYVTIELVNLGQGFLISSDLKIYDSGLDCPCSVRSSNLCQELGMVSNVFADKTGTLTRNEMKFVKFIIDGQMYDVEGDKVENGKTTLSAVSQQLALPNSKNSKIYSFLRCLTTCHTVVREKDGTYRAESPDELALVEGVGKFKCGLLERGTVMMLVEFLGERQNFEILAVNAFNADRKRMSVLLRDTLTKQYSLMCKGADNIMLPLCKMADTERRSVEKSLLDLAVLGLRTLCIAEKQLSEAEAVAWLNNYKVASSSLDDRSTKLANAASSIESNMTLLGITAIEDRLQDEVPEVIADLAKAGVILWMLTGDKEETAVNIGRSCNLILADTKIYFMTQITNPADYSVKLKTVYDDVMAHYVEGQGYMHNGEKKEIALVLDGPSLCHFADKSTEERNRMLSIGKLCRSVIGCRLTPVQKQQLVGLVKKDSVPKAITLSIGDGANDVSMIREADVGVGIFGKEGRQAANNADFAIGQFKFLRNLLLVHGRWNYCRQSRVFLYSMHKNMVITLTLFWYSYFTAVSGTSPYESWVYTSFNFILGLPIIFYGIQDRDISSEFALKNPEVYVTGKENAYLNYYYIGWWILNAVAYATVICLVMYYVVSPTFESFGLYGMGTTVFSGLCMALQCKVGFMHNQWTWPQAFVMGLSVGGMLLWYIILTYSTTDYWGEGTWLYGESIFWFFGMFSVPLFTAMVDICEYYSLFFFRPNNEMLFRETEHKSVFLADPFYGRKQDASSPVNHHTTSNNNNTNANNDQSHDQPNAVLI